MPCVMQPATKDVSSVHSRDSLEKRQQDYKAMLVRRMTSLSSKGHRLGTIASTCIPKYINSSAATQISLSWSLKNSSSNLNQSNIPNAPHTNSNTFSRAKQNISNRPCPQQCIASTTSQHIPRRNLGVITSRVSVRILSDHTHSRVSSIS